MDGQMCLQVRGILHSLTVALCFLLERLEHLDQNSYVLSHYLFSSILFFIIFRCQICLPPQLRLFRDRTAFEKHCRALHNLAPSAYPGDPICTKALFRCRLCPPNARPILYERASITDHLQGHHRTTPSDYRQVLIFVCIKLEIFFHSFFFAGLPLPG